MARASKYWTGGFEVVTLSAFIWVFDEVEDATKVWTNAAVGNHISRGQFNDETRDLANFSSLRVVLKVLLIEHEGKASPWIGKIFVCESRNWRLSQRLV